MDTDSLTGGHYHPNHVAKEKSLLASTLLNFSISLTEVAGGLLSGSLALFSDALHNLGDSFAIFIAYIASLISKRGITDRKTFGYKRIEILAALFNAVVLIVIIVYLFIEAYRRLSDPMPIKGMIMLLVALAGLLANLVSVFLLRHHAKKDINVKAAYLHLVGDTISSLVVIVSAILIHFFNLYWIDPLVTILLGLYLLRETYSVLRETVDILMQGTPEGLDLRKVKEALEAIPGIRNIHHVHAWNLNDREIHFECHVDLIQDIRISETDTILEQIRQILRERYQIAHITIQYGFHCCDDTAMLSSGTH